MVGIYACSLPYLYHNGISSFYVGVLTAPRRW